MFGCSDDFKVFLNNLCSWVSYEDNEDEEDDEEDSESDDSSEDNYADDIYL